jgi:catechol 2,3-dioxygenase-like lactoylglutathione lyase family enzyme
MIRGVHHVAIATPDIDRMIAFYRDALGFEVVSQGEWKAGSPVIDQIVGLQDSASRTAMLRAGNIYLEAFQYVTPEGRAARTDRTPADHGYTHFCLDVVDIDAEFERLSAAGMTFLNPPPAAGTVGGGAIRALYGRDPDGNIIELQEVLDPNYPRQLDL